VVEGLLTLIILSCLGLLVHCHYRKPIILESEQDLKIAAEAAEVREAWNIFYAKASALKKYNVTLNLIESCKYSSPKYIWFTDPVKLDIRISKSKAV